MESTSGLQTDTVSGKPLPREEGRGTQGTVQGATAGTKNLAGLSRAVQDNKGNGFRNNVPTQQKEITT